MGSVPNDRAIAFFETHVVPARDVWRRSPRDLRVSMNLAVSLNQMADHFWHQYHESEPTRVHGKTNVSVFRKFLAEGNPSFGLIRDVADAHKHVKLDRPDRVLTSAGQTSHGSLGWGEAEYGVGEFGGEEEVVIELDSGARRHFSGVVRDVFGMWHVMLGRAAA
jgi:hypothetical protein